MSEISQYVLSGLAVGCVYAFIALGLVVVGNVTRIFNFAAGEYVMVGGMVMAVTASGMPIALGIVLAVAVTVGVAVLQERLTVAPVRDRISILQAAIVTLGVGTALRGGALLVWDQYPHQAQPFQEGTFRLLGASLSGQDKWIWLTTAVALVAVVLLFSRTDLGRAMRACAINPVVAQLNGIRVGAMSLAAFALAGGLCGLIAAVSVSITGASWESGITVGLVGFIAAALAGFTSPTRAVIAGLALGVVEQLAAGLISSDYRQAIVYGTLVVYLLARDFYGSDGVISRWLQGRRASTAGSVDLPDVRTRIHAGLDGLLDRRRRSLSARSDDATSKKSKFEEVVGHRPSLLMFLPIVLLGLAAFFPGTTNDLGELDTGVFILLAAMAATGLGLVIGLAGQFSLGQAGFVLVSGYTAAILTADHGWNPFLALIVAVGASVVIGTLIGMLTLRLEGLNLALATLALLVIAVVVVTQAEGLTHGSAGVQGVSGLEFFGLKVESSQDFFLVCLGILAAMLLIARNIWYSRMGRSLRAIGIDQEAAESVGLDAWRMKLAIFVLGASMAGVSGVLWTYYLHYAANDTWGVKLTIELVTFVVVGGAVSPYGAAVGATAVGLLQYWFREHVGTSIGGASSSYEVVLSGALIIIFVLVFRRGLASIPQALAERIERRRAAGGDAEEPAAAAPAGVGSWVREGGADVPVVSEVGPSAQTSSSSLPLVVVEDLTKRFGDLIAVNGVSLDLRPGEVTAMIGPNGAGKSTVVNMLAGGLVPSAGSVGILGRPLVGLRPQRIAQLGLARTFQTPRLFDGMTVLETVMLARDRYGSRSWIWSNALRTPRSLRDERAARERALEWLAFVGLAEDAELPANTLPVGKQRMAEVARALATEPAVLLLDEPAAGLDGRETVGLAALIRELGNAGIAVLLVEHDMAMVMSIADQIVVLEEGKKIAEGTPAEIGSDQTVIDAYLGVVHA